VVLKDGADFFAHREKKTCCRLKLPKMDEPAKPDLSVAGWSIFGSFSRPYVHALGYHLNSISFFPDHISRLMELVPANLFDRS
jgi:hypothetical protein